jgi:hypothetical protein
MASDRTAARHLSFVVAYNSEDSYTPTSATLWYRRSDPFVVSLDFGPGNVWEFALYMLRDGLVIPSGQGDVRIASVAGCVSITLKSPAGIIVLLAARQPPVSAERTRSKARCAGSRRTKRFARRAATS